MASFLSAWLADEARALALLGPGVRDAATRRRAVEVAQRRGVSPALADALRATDDGLPPNAARRARLERLVGGSAAAIVTGQQAGLFLGPLLTFYKAASAVVLARALEAETGAPCVPVFWLQDEDHDWVEVDHVWIQGATQPVRIGLPDDRSRPSVAHRRLGDEIVAARAVLADHLGGLPHAPEHLAQLDDAYRPGRGVAEAFAHLLCHVFADDGLVIVDPRSAAVGALTHPQLQRAIRDHAAIESALVDRDEAIEAAGFDRQVPLRPGSPLAFFHLDGVDGPRHRLQHRDDGRWDVIGSDRVVSQAELDDAGPLRLSSSALWRPLVQDTLLPTAAYVGGPAEAAYFAQLAPLYPLVEVPMPMFALRARVRVLEAQVRSLLERCSLDAAAVEAPRDALLARLVRSEHIAPEALRAELLGPIEARLAALDLAAVDTNLERPIARTRETIAHAVGRLVERYARARLDRDRVARERADRLRLALYPNDTPQERVYGVSHLLSAYGSEAFRKTLLDAIAPYEAKILELVP